MRIDRVHARRARDGVADRPSERLLRSDSRTWAELGLVSGVVAVAAYAVASAVPMSPALQAVAVSIFGPGIALASAGLYEVLRLHRSTVGLKIGLVANIAAGITANGLQVGLDVAWDVFLAFGTFLLALNMWTHPRFGHVFAITGGVLAALLLTLNLGTFPEPPPDGGLVDPGPLVGLWYLVAAIRIGSSLRWVDRNAAVSNSLTR